MKTNMNTNATEILRNAAIAALQPKIDELNNIAKRFTEDRAGYMHRPGHIYPTTVLEQIAQYGAENIFQYIEDYHGKYEDDYCYFHYVNNVTGETFGDSWTTAGACPAFHYYECISLQEAIKVGMPIHPEIEKMFRTCVKNACMELLKGYDSVRNHYDFRPLIGRLIKVERGRKWRGTGYLIEVREDSFYLPYGGRNTTHTAVVFDSTNNTICEVNANYAAYADQDTFNAEYEAWVDANLKDLTLDKILPNYGSCHYELTSKLHPCNFYRIYIEKHPIPSAEGADYPAERERKAKVEVKRELKRQQLEVWASKFTDKTQEERDFMVKRALIKQFGY